MEMNKDLIGKIIYAKPMGNNARGSSATFVQKFKVVGVARKYIKLQIEYRDGAYGNTESYCPLTGSTQSQINAGYGGNAGYKFFLNEDEIEKYNKTIKMRNEIYDFFRRYNKLDYNQCVSILEIINHETK